MGERVLMKGNEAIAQAAISAGCRHFFGYPITPQTEVAAYMSKMMPKVGGVYLQGESEVASINMVLGAGAAGVRVMTSTSSPGISLMSEGISYMTGILYLSPMSNALATRSTVSWIVEGANTMRWKSPCPVDLVAW